MSYEKQTFIDHETTLTAAHLQHIEDGIVMAFEEIAKVSQLLPKTAEVGQIIKVSEVDANGNIVAMEAVNLSDELEDTPMPAEVTTEAEMTALLETAEVGAVYKYAGETGTYENGALYIISEE